MPIYTPHPLYNENIEKWKKCRIAYEGEDAVKAAGTDYLPKLTTKSNSTAKYNAYKQRAMFFEIAARTVDGFVGAIARKEPEIDAPEKLLSMLNDIDSSGINYIEFIKSLCKESLLIGRCGILVDYNEAAAKPTMALYTAESIINWDENSIVLSEVYFEVDKQDIFKKETKTQYRELGFDESGNYVQNIWRLVKTQTLEEWQVVETITPSKRKKPLLKTPFFWLSAMGATPRICKPPMLGIVNISLSHYRNSADLEHGRHWSGLPTLYVTGWTDGQEIEVGGESAITLADPNGKVGYADFDGKGLQSIENGMAQKEAQMAALGASILTGSQRKGVEAAETSRIRASGENSLLMGVVSAVEEAFANALKVYAEWADVADKIEVKINRDFIDARLQPQELSELVKAYQAGAISIGTFLYNLNQAEMLPPTSSIEEETNELKKANNPTQRVDNPMTGGQA